MQIKVSCTVLSYGKSTNNNQLLISFVLSFPIFPSRMSYIDAFPTFGYLHGNSSVTE
jgi:hypothetical protein